MDTSDEQSARLAALERQVAALADEVAQLRGVRGQARAEPRAVPSAPLRGAGEIAGIQRAAGRLYDRATTAQGAALTGDEIESFVGRYGTLLLAALAILMAVGVLVQVAVSRGLLTPEVRVALGALVALVVGGAGLHFRRRGEIRYGDVLLSIALAIVDLVAWGAGPELHLVPSAVALAVVDVVAVGIGLLALHDDNEFLFAVAVGGALSAPFVTSTGGGTRAMLLIYGAAVLASALRLVRDPWWRRAFGVLVGGAAVYMLAAAAMPAGLPWYEPHLVTLFGGLCALAALLLAQEEWRGDLARSVLALSVIGVLAAWDRAAATPVVALAGISVALVLIIHAALAVRRPPPSHWIASALLLPLISLAVAYPAAERWIGGWGVLATWGMIALVAWRFERGRGELERGGAHLLSAGVLGSLALVDGVWAHPLALVAALGLWGTCLSAAAASEPSPLPLGAIVLALGGAGAFAVDQLASRQPYAYMPFATRSSASAFCVAIALLASSELIGRGDAGAAGAGGLDRWADRPLRLGVVVGFVILWGRMELAHAFSRDLATFLLILYYAAFGLATILAGRRLAVQRLRLAGLGMSVYAAVKAMVEVTGIDGILLRVGSYGAVGLFLLGAGYLYRVRRETGRAAESVAT